MGPTGTVGTTSFDLIVQENTAAGPTGPAYSLIRNPVAKALGHVLSVDAVYGNNAAAAANPYSFPFLTISAALAVAVSGDTVYVYPGTYNESLTLPTDVNLRGINVNAVVIQKLAVTTNTTMVTVSGSSRIEDVTITVTSATNGVTLKGIDLQSASAQSCKIRTCVMNVTSTATGSASVYGIYSAGTSSTALSSFDTVCATTINVRYDGTGGVARGIYVNGANRVNVRDTNIFVQNGKQLNRKVANLR
jgi:hypothetical protein